MRRILAVLATVLGLMLAGCAAGQPAPSDAIDGDLAISAAASLQGAFDEAAEEFTAAHPGVHVVVTYDGSSTLATQIDNGARVDVFASADEVNMARITDAGLASDGAVFARNTLVVVTPKGDPAGVRTLADLAKPGIKTVLCAPAVPCGAASQKLLQSAGVEVVPVSQEQNVTAVLTKVHSDEADAGLVYKTDAATADVDSFVPEGADQVVNSYPIAVLDDAPNPTAATAFVAFIRGDAGQRILASFGFETA